MIADIEKYIDGYVTKAKLCIEAHDDDIQKAEKLVSKPIPQAYQTPGTPIVDQWTQFRPQFNLTPTYLEKEANHLEVSKFCKNMRTYIEDGFRGADPENVWMYMSPFISSSWWSSFENRGVKQKGLKEILGRYLDRV